MSSIDNKVKQSFDAVCAPEEIKQQTLTYILDQQAEKDANQTENRPNNVVPAPRFRAHTYTRLIAAAACLLLMACCLGGWRMYTQPTAYVGVEVNPSIELTLNCFDRVIAAEGLNADGEVLLESVSLTNMSFEDALNTLSQSETFGEYAQGDALVQVSVVSDNQNQAETLLSQSSQELESLPCETNCAIYDAEIREEALEAQMGVARYCAAQDVLAVTSAYTLDELSQLSMRELQDLITENGGSLDDSAGYGQGSQSTGTGQGQNSQGQGQGMQYGKAN